MSSCNLCYDYIRHFSFHSVSSCLHTRHCRITHDCVSALTSPSLPHLPVLCLSLPPTFSEAVNTVVDMLSLAPVEGTQEVSAFVGVHAVNLAGVFLGDVPVLARVGFVKDQKNNVMIKVSQIKVLGVVS